MRTARNIAAITAAAALLAGCATEPLALTPRPAVAPPSGAAPGAAPLDIRAAAVKPMYTELLAVDLPTVISVASASNLDIQQARQRVAERQGEYEARVGSIFPVLAPTAIFDYQHGGAQAVTGDIVNVNFRSFYPAFAIQWVVNPGRVYYDVVASKRRLTAAQQQQQAVGMETLRSAAVQYYDLVFAQAEVASAEKAIGEAQELVRINALKRKAGAGVPADELRAQAALAADQQELALALNRFYRASVALAEALHLDAALTLVPASPNLSPAGLVAPSLSIERLLGLAVEHRPDLAEVRTLVEAADAETKSAIWGGLGPDVGASYSVGAIGSKTRTADFGMTERQRGLAFAQWNLGLSTFGSVKSADARHREAILDAQRQLDRVRAQVVTAAQDSDTAAKLIPMARTEVQSAEEALRLIQQNLRAGTMADIDVLAAQSVAAAARVRYAQALVRYNQAQVNLLASLGLIDAGHLLGDAAEAKASVTPSPAAGAIAR